MDSHSEYNFSHHSDIYIYTIPYLSRLDFEPSGGWLYFIYYIICLYLFMKLKFFATFLNTNLYWLHKIQWSNGNLLKGYEGEYVRTWCKCVRPFMQTTQLAAMYKFSTKGSIKLSKYCNVCQRIGKYSIWKIILNILIRIECVGSTKESLISIYSH